MTLHKVKTPKTPEFTVQLSKDDVELALRAAIVAAYPQLKLNSMEYTLPV